MSEAPLPEPPTPTPTPMLKSGRYAVVGTLGEGSQGTTLDAVDKREGCPVAIKRFDVRGARTWKDVELAEREARVLSSLSHPKLPRYIDHFEENGVLYLVMEKIEGTPLSVLRKRGAMREADVERLLRDADDVLTYLSRVTPAVVHRDLKPSNVIRRPDGSYAFVDFGAVRDRMRPEGGSTVVGTFGYMAPEQFQGRAGPGSDVYAIGATALALLTGEEPENLPHRGLSIDVDAALAGSASRRMREALSKMLEPDPDRRPTRILPLLAPKQTTQRVHCEKKRSGRRAEQRARRAERKARRRNAKSTGVPWPVSMVLALALGVAQLAVLLTLRVAVPMVLVILSLVFGRALRDAARSVGSAGGRAVSVIGRARQFVAGGYADGDEGGVRVRNDDSSDAPRARVSERDAQRDAHVVDVDLEDEQLEDEEDESEPRARRRSGRFR